MSWLGSDASAPFALGFRVARVHLVWLIVAVSVPIFSAAASAGPVRYGLQGVGSGSLGEMPFERQHFSLDIEGQGRNIERGIEAAEPGIHSGFTWFRQDPLSRVVFRMGHRMAVTVDPVEYQLLAVNYGSGQALSADHDLTAGAGVSLCASGLAPQECREAATFQLAVAEPLEFGTQYHYVPTDARGTINLQTTLGALRLGQVEDADLRVSPPAQEPPFYASLLAGLSILVFGMRHRAGPVS